MVFCGSCGASNDDNAQFCSGCGEALEFEEIGSEEVVEEVVEGSDEVVEGSEEVVEEIVEEGEEGGEEVVEEGEGEEVVEEVVEEGEEGGEEEVVEVVEVVEEGEEGGEEEVVEVVEEVVVEEPKVEQSNSKGAVIHKTKRTGKKVRGSRKVKWENAQEVTNLIAEVLNNETYAGWILVGYQDDNCTLEIQAHGTGGVSEFVPLLQDDQWQYVITRITDKSKGINTGGAIAETTRDIFITWQGQKVSIIQRGRFNEHRNTIKKVMKPYHADLVAIGKTKFDENEVRKKSAPLSGSHEIS